MSLNRILRMRHNGNTAVPLSAATGDRRTVDIVQRLFRDYPGRLAVRLWNGHTLAFGRGAPEFTLVFHDPHPFRELILHRDPLRLAEAFFLGKIDIEGDLYAALRLKDHLGSLHLSAQEKAGFLLGAFCLSNASEGMGIAAVSGRRASRMHRFPQAHTRGRDRQAIAYHYDVSNDFYSLWLDEHMVYSCAYFERRRWTGRGAMQQARPYRPKTAPQARRTSAGYRMRLGRVDPLGGETLRRARARHHPQQQPI